MGSKKKSQWKSFLPDVGEPYLPLAALHLVSATAWGRTLKGDVAVSIAYQHIRGVREAKWGKAKRLRLEGLDELSREEILWYALSEVALVEAGDWIERDADIRLLIAEAHLRELLIEIG